MIDKYKYFELNFNNSIKNFNNIDEIKEKLTYLRWKSCENADQLLFEFETNVKRNNGKIIWCPSPKDTLTELNKLIQNDKTVNFNKHTYINHFNELNDLKLEFNQNSETVVVGAKFLIANTGNIFVKLNNQEEFENLISAKKVVIVAGIDALISSQSDLQFIKQVYSTFETGNLGYNFEMLLKPAKNKGIETEFHLLLTDFGLDFIIQNPIFRPLSYLFNFDYPQFSILNFLNEKEFNLLFQLFYSILLNDEKYLHSFSSVYIENDKLPLKIDINKILRELKSDKYIENKLTIIQKIFGQSFIKRIKDSNKFNQEKNFKDYFENYFVKK